MSMAYKGNKIKNGTLDTSVKNYQSKAFAESEFFNSNDASQLISTISFTSLDSLKDSIKDIEELISSREKLHKKLMGDIGKQEIEVNNFLSSLLDQSDGFSREKLLLFKEKAIELGEARRQEQLSSWQDVAKLREELRDLKRRVQDKETRMGLLDTIMTRN